MSLRAASVASAVWVAIALAFGAVLLLAGERADAEAFLAGYLVEKSLSLDNVFVFLLVFTAFGLPDAERHRLLSYGIVAALALRLVFIVVGAAALSAFGWLSLRLRRLPRSGRAGRCSATATTTAPRRRWSSGCRSGSAGWSLSTGAAAFAAIAIVDVIFAVDSVPAILAITSDTFIVFAANAFALLGLRPLFFLVADLVERLYYLKTALAVLLVFIGAKMAAAEFVGKIGPEYSLPAIAAILGTGVVASLVRNRRAILRECDFPESSPPSPRRSTRAARVDLDALAANARSLLDAGLTGLVGNGTMGEAGSLSADERRSVIEALVDAAGDRVTVTAGVSAQTAEAATAYARAAADAGAGALMLLPPLMYGGDEREVLAFYAAVAAATDLPIMAYNNPVASGGTDMLPAFILRLAREVDSVVAIKECSGDARRLAELLAGAGDGFEVLVGGDDWALEGFAAGATGWISGVSSVAPEECVALLRHVQDGELDAARELYTRLLPLARLDMTPKLVQFFKAAQDAVGRAGGPCRPPRLELTGEDRAVLDAALGALRGQQVPA